MSETKRKRATKSAPKIGNIPRDLIEQAVKLVSAPKKRMSTRSCKAKGANGQKEIVKILRMAYPELAEDDIRSNPMGSQGEDIIMSPAARTLLPVSIEVKRGKALNLIKACKQAEYHCRTRQHLMPISMGRYDHDKQWYACVRLEDLLRLFK